MDDLLKKLGIQAGQLICLMDARVASRQMLLDLVPVSVTVHPKLRDMKYDLIFFWPFHLEGLAGDFAALQAHLKPDGALWVVMPKKKFARQQGIDYTWEQMQTAGLTTDLVDNKIATINDQDYGTRFVIRKKSRKST